VPVATDTLPESVELAHPAGNGEFRDRIRAAIPAEERQELQIAEQIAARRPAFLANRRLDVEKMLCALAARDFSAIQHVGHNSKGIGTGYGFPDISRIGSIIETAAKARNVIEVEQAIEQFAKFIQAAGSDQTDGVQSPRV
jgi:hypothetical protein